MNDETPEDRFKAWLEQPVPESVEPDKPGLVDRLLPFVAFIASAILWGGIGYAILRHLVW